MIDDHSRITYAEIRGDEKAATAIGVLQRAVACFADHGVTVERVVSDNGSAYKSYAWRDACTDLGIKPKGCTSTITTAPTPPSEASQQSPVNRLTNLPGHHG